MKTDSLFCSALLVRVSVAYANPEINTYGVGRKFYSAIEPMGE